ncbi:MAG TPA: folylpolyglutamate synthase/dihydrofolate synthase family protein [Bacteroidota bacterium]|nr:folylpolyglutamate synthase/dihydrofolate synthase family protein [Bacteroidota bacterium]
MTLRSKSSALSFLYGLQKFGIKLGLRNIRHLCASLGHPETRFSSVHIAGTNGKGSTSSMIAAVLTAAGYKVGLYTSPHLVEFNERIRINGRSISDRSLIRYANLIRPDVEQLGATFFEATTAIAFRYFADNHVDIAVVETGLGGRLDATNVLNPRVSVITSIGKDHTEVLGTTIEQIAREKGGIIKPGIPCVLGRMQTRAKKCLESIARANSSAVLSVEDIAVGLHSDGTLSFETPGHRYISIDLSLKGEFQWGNAAAAIAALEVLKGQGFRIPDADLRIGLSCVGQLTGLKARLQIVRRRPRILCDVAHNPDAARVLAASIAEMAHRTIHIIFGVMKDKDFDPMIQALAALQPKFYAVEASIARSLPAGDLCRALIDAGCDAEAYGTIRSALASAVAHAHADDIILITGSHYVVGEAMVAMKRGAAQGRKKN